MAITITVEQVREFMGADYADVPTSTIETYICLVNKMDTCLDANYLDDTCTQTAIKLNAIGHFTALGSGRVIKSQRAPSGASRSFEYMNKLEGLKMTAQGRILEMVDSAGCFNSLFHRGSFGVVGLGRKCKDY